MAGKDFFGSQEQRIGRKPLALGKCWVEGFAQRDNLVNKLDVWWGGTLALRDRYVGAQGRHTLIRIGLLATTDEVQSRQSRRLGAKRRRSKMVGMARMTAMMKVKRRLALHVNKLGR